MRSVSAAEGAASAARTAQARTSYSVHSNDLKNDSETGQQSHKSIKDARRAPELGPGWGRASKAFDARQQQRRLKPECFEGRRRLTVHEAQVVLVELVRTRGREQAVDLLHKDAGFRASVAGLGREGLGDHGDERVARRRRRRPQRMVQDEQTLPDARRARQEDPACRQP